MVMDTEDISIFRSQLKTLLFPKSYDSLSTDLCIAPLSRCNLELEPEGGGRDFTNFLGVPFPPSRVGVK